MKAFDRLTVAAACLILSTGAAEAQDMNTVDRHLQHQQETRVQDHQNRMRSAPTPPRPEGQTTARACSPDALPAGDRSRMEARYREIHRRQGEAAARAYAREQGRRFGQRLIAEGVCTSDGRTGRPAESGGGQPGRATDADADGGCRMEMVPVAGLGGAPMTMSMVPVCD